MNIPQASRKYGGGWMPVAATIQQIVEHLCQVGQAGRVERLTGQLENFLNLGKQVLRQARQVNAGQLNLPERVVSLFDPEARPIRRGKAHRETEFGYKVCLTETAERLVTAYSVEKGNPPDEGLLVPGVRAHINHTGRPPDSLATDRGFWHPDNEDALKALGVRRVSLPYKGKRSCQRTEHERQPWFRRLQRWRSGQEGTISVLKRGYGLDRTLYCGWAGCKRWVGGAIWGYNLNRITKLI